MTSPTLDLVPVSDAAELLPPGSPAGDWLAADSQRHACEHALRVRGDLHLPALDLDDPLGAGGALCSLFGASPGAATRPLLIVVDGDLRVDGAVFNADTDGACGLVVLGDASVSDAVIGGQLVYVRGALSVRGLLWGDYNHGDLCVQGGVTAGVALFTDEYHVRIEGGERFDWLIDEVRDDADRAVPSGEAVGALLRPEFVDAIADGDGGASNLIDRDAVIEALREGRPLLLDKAQREALLPHAADPFDGETPCIDNLQRIIGSAVLAPGENRAEGWFGQVFFSITRSHVNADGDQRDDNVFINDWKSFDFYAGIDRKPAKESMMDSIKSVLFHRAAPMEAHLDLIYRSYSEGEPGEWKALCADEPAVWKVFMRAWRGVLDYVRKAEAQARGGYPLWRRVQQEIGAQGVLALARLPVFVDEYNDWWDADKCGFWLDDVWVGVRQPCRHDGEDYAPALKLAWANGDEAPGDDEDDAKAACLLICNGEGADEPLALRYLQRQSESSVPLPRGAADHLLRVLRLCRGVSRRLIADHERALARQAEARRIEQAVYLLMPPPLAADAGDEAVFPPALLALSDAWQAQGRDYVQAIRAHQQRFDAAAEESGTACPDAGEDADGDDGEPPDDPRKALAPMVLQLARVVSRHADADLAARFRRRFAFAPDACIDRVREAGQCVGPLFLLDDRRIVARIGAAYADDVRWVVIDGVSLAPLPGVTGLGRSVDRRCFARCDGSAITTHAGFDGPCIARFTLPAGNEGLPDSFGMGTHPNGARCDALIPFNDGRRVLLLNPTGVYLVDERGVRRIHPQTFDEDGPYTWPKNQLDNSLALDMLHMALSPDELHIVLGDQDSRHVLLDAGGTVLREWEPASSYPHHAVFLPDGRRVLLNSCHFYSGATLAARVDADDEPDAFEMQSRVYASCTAADLVVLGNAEGYLHALDGKGRMRWRHHVGSSISALEISPDGRSLLAGSYGGYLVRLALGEDPDPWSIGTSPFHERQRWIFWEDEPAPIRW